jgi:peptidoglycan/xylan/chitin deacetylase (PgdA/CDA1 family)
MGKTRQKTKVDNRLVPISFVLLFLLLGLHISAVAAEPQDYRIPILVYHRFGETVSDSMTVSVTRFESQLKYLRDNDYKVIPLTQLVQNRLTGEPALPERAVIITADDGHRSVYAHMLGLARKYQVPVTLFIYPSAISNADYALTWEQLTALKKAGLFDVQSHSYWHPNFNQEKRRLGRREYDQFVRMQFVKSKEILEAKLGGKVDLLAWPFGLFDDELIGKAAEAGYVAGFTLAGRHVTPRDPVMALPRYLITQSVDLKVFSQLMSGKHASWSKGY